MQNKYRNFNKSPFLQFLFTVVLAGFFAFIIVSFGFRSYHVFGDSMKPTLQEGDILIISKTQATWSRFRSHSYIPERGDIVVLNSPISDTRLVKRVIGLPGERIAIQQGRVLVYNQENPSGFDPYQKLNIQPTFTSGSTNALIPESHIYVIGDNRSPGGSSDSRNELGPVPSEYIIGELTLRIWPVNKISVF